MTEHSSRELLLRAVAGLAALALVGVYLATEDRGGDPDLAAELAATISLGTDDGGGVLLDIDDAAPGAPHQRCIAVAYAGPDGTADLVLHVEGGGDLAEHLHWRVEAGGGGGFDSCDGFDGAEAYAGTLAGFLAEHGQAEDALAVGELLGPEDTTVFRFTAEVEADDAAQGATATTDLAWTATADAPEEQPADEPTDEPADEPTDEPADEPVRLPAPPPGPGPAPAPEPRPEPEADPEPTTPAPGATTPPPDSPPPGAEDSDPGGQDEHGLDDEAPADAPPEDDETLTWGERVGEVLRDVGALALEAAERSTFPILLLLLMLLFLAVQDRIDRRDPKLALAPLRSEPDAEFLPPHGGRR